MKYDPLLVFYLNAKHYVFKKGYFNEAYFQEKRSLDFITKADFYREYAWVVLSSGLSEKVVISVFPKLTTLFNNWRNPFLIISNRKSIYKKAIIVFGNKRKISAILGMANYLIKKSISAISNSIKREGLEYLMRFKYLGPATAFHLAKNLGVDIAKPDRHLIRISHQFGFKCLNTFCEIISTYTGDKKSVVDIILWRYATLNRNYLSET